MNFPHLNGKIDPCLIDGNLLYKLVENTRDFNHERFIYHSFYRIIRQNALGLNKQMQIFQSQ